jgi:hypothetical protein
MPANLHAELNERELHHPKGYSTAGDNTYPARLFNGGYGWCEEYYQKPVESFVTCAELFGLGLATDRARYIVTDVCTTAQVSSTAIFIDTTATTNVLAEIFYVDSNGDQMLQPVWHTTAPKEGYLAHRKDNDTTYLYNGTEWVPFLVSSSTPAQVFSFKKTITSAQVLTANSNPIELVAAPGTGKYIRPIECTVYIDFNTTPYATNLTPVLQDGGGSDITFRATNLLNADTAKMGRMSEIFVTYGASTLDLKENQALAFSVNSGDPTAGDSDITVFGTYTIIEI